MKIIRYSYYPGCTQETTAREYNESVKAVCKALGVDLAELPGWTCCGASSAHATDYLFSHALAGRNLAIADKMNHNIAVACPACYLRLNSTLHELRTQVNLRRQLSTVIPQGLEARVKVKHILDILVNDIGLETIRNRITKPLSGLTVVAYYGCYLVRPPELTSFDNAENPQSLDNLLKALGANVPDWRGKVQCCGGSHSFTLKNKVTSMVSEIIEAALEVKAEAIVTACPLCQVNLETRQVEKNKLPIFYFSELMALGMNIADVKWWGRHLITQKLF